MKQIRRNVFETNSSSSHSISIKKAGSILDIEAVEKNGNDEYGYISPKGVLHLYDSDLEFGRSPFDMLSRLIDKAKYAIASMAQDAEKREEIEAVLYEVIPGLTSIRYPETRNYRTGQWGPYYGNIDHQSWGTLQHFLKEHNITIRDFLLDTRYVVWIDGDEYKIKDKLIDNCIIHKDDFESL